MRTWSRATSDTQRCGSCGKTLERGTPLMEIRFITVKRVLVRCVECIGVEPPPDLPPLVERTAAPSGEFAHVAAAAPRTRGALKQTAREWTPYREED